MDRICFVHVLSTASISFVEDALEHFESSLKSYVLTHFGASMGRGSQMNVIRDPGVVFMWRLEVHTHFVT